MAWTSPSLADFQIAWKKRWAIRELILGFESLGGDTDFLFELRAPEGTRKTINRRMHPFKWLAPKARYKPTDGN